MSSSGIGGIILCGGSSRRMGGYPKAQLPVGAETMLERIWRIVAQSCSPVVVVTGVDPSNEFPDHWNVVSDRVQGRGPIEGLAVGLAALSPDVEWTFVTSCDTPLVCGQFIRELTRHAGQTEAQAVVVEDDQRQHPLPALYRVDSRRKVESQITAGKLRLGELLQSLRIASVAATQLESREPLLEYQWSGRLFRIA